MSLEDADVMKEAKDCETCKAAIRAFLFLNKTGNLHGQKLEGVATICLKHLKVFGFDVTKILGPKESG